MGTSLRPGEGAVLVGHGNDHALLLPLSRKTTQRLTRKAMTTMTGYLNGTEKRKTEVICNSVDIHIKSKSDFLDLVDGIDALCDQRIGHVALRACNPGKSGAGFLEDDDRIIHAPAYRQLIVRGHRQTALRFRRRKRSHRQPNMRSRSKVSRNRPPRCRLFWRSNSR